jgi:UDPglucose--hexose-1-phosphate uridylyltransferase
MEKAPVVKTYRYKKYKDVEVGLVKWPLSVIRLKGTAAKDLVSTAADILAAWRAYSQGEIISHTGDIPHNTITPIARVRDCLEFDLVLRNNRTTAEHPLGLFHPHSEWHHIKKENIGLIEVMGLAVLPGRLKQEIEAGRLNREEISEVFVNVLKDCGVFEDIGDFDRFIRGMGME